MYVNTDTMIKNVKPVESNINIPEYTNFKGDLTEYNFMLEQKLSTKVKATIF